MNWILHLTGVDNTSGSIYGFWSGFGSDLAEFAIILTLYRKLNCHVTSCKRLGLHHVEGTPYVTCRRHHPEDRLTVEHIRAAHRRAK